MSLRKIIESKKLLVQLGAGGVGKTTSSIALALMAARSGRHVALLSIDPARRLADALGIRLGDTLTDIALPAAWQKQPGMGSLAAAMIDQKATFDRMVKKHAPSPNIAARILDNPIYRAASTNLSGPLEYMALAKVHELSMDDRYDVVVLDTPPDHQALDFLARPNVLTGFTESKVMSWLLKPFAVADRLGFGRFLSASERMMGGVAKVAGVESLRTFADFLVLTSEVIDGFQQSGDQVSQLLQSEGCRFLLVTVPTASAVRSAVNMMEQLASMRFALHGIILNRCLPGEVCKELREKTYTLSQKNQEVGQDKQPITGRAADILEARFRSQALLETQLTTALETSHGLSVSKPISESTPHTSRLYRVDEFSGPLLNIEALGRFAEAFSR